jgi:hypothetical protein
MHIFHRCQTVLATASLLVFLGAPAWAQSQAAAQAPTPISSSCHPTADSVSATPTKAASDTSPGNGTNGNLENQDTSENPPVLQSLPLPSAPILAATNSCLSITQICLPGNPRCCGSLRCRLPNGQPPYRCLP